MLYSSFWKVIIPTNAPVLTLIPPGRPFARPYAGGASNASQLVNTIRDLGQSMRGTPVLLALVDDYNESDVLSLMNEGVSTVITDYTDLLAFKATLAAAIKQAALLRDKHAQLKDVTETAHTALKTASGNWHVDAVFAAVHDENRYGISGRRGLRVSFCNLGLKGCFRAKMLEQELVRSTEGEPSAIQLTLLESLSERIAQPGRILGFVASTAWVVSGPALVDEALAVVCVTF